MGSLEDCSPTTTLLKSWLGVSTESLAGTPVQPLPPEPPLPDALVVATDEVVEVGSAPPVEVVVVDALDEAPPLPSSSTKSPRPRRRPQPDAPRVKPTRGRRANFRSRMCSFRWRT